MIKWYFAKLHVFFKSRSWKQAEISWGKNCNVEFRKVCNILHSVGIFWKCSNFCIGKCLNNHTNHRPEKCGPSSAPSPAEECPTRWSRTSCRYAVACGCAPDKDLWRPSDVTNAVSFGFVIRSFFAQKRDLLKSLVSVSCLGGWTLLPQKHSGWLLLGPADPSVSVLRDLAFQFPIEI